jgi:hypothetical protein
MDVDVPLPPEGGNTLRLVHQLLSFVLIALVAGAAWGQPIARVQIGQWTAAK